ncbi:hypothetical protein NDU88_003783 [Pleurodeles waltl]|uniref:Secreted protein n=1 Tax=Pleurodeles waltl TaxID=8319 RepID=A0AAV7TS46_PLEWA|nr:hypothetical protein NDU88_003783 [Pleurodeles waltl]
MTHVGPTPCQVAAIMLAHIRMLASAPCSAGAGVVAPRRWVTPGVWAISPRSNQFFGLSSPRTELSQAGAQRQPPSWFPEVARETRCFLLSRYSLLAGVYSAFIRRVSAHWGLS